MEEQKQSEPFVSKINPYLPDKEIEDKYKQLCETGLNLNVGIEGFCMYVFGNRVNIPFPLIRHAETNSAMIEIIIIKVFEAGVVTGRSEIRTSIRKALDLS